MQKPSALALGTEGSRSDRMKLVAGNSNRPLAEAIATYLKTPLAKCVVRRFADDEIFVEVEENVRGEDVFVIQSTSAPANDHLMELLIIIDALKRASARRITAAVPYFGHQREDPEPGPRPPASGSTGRRRGPIRAGRWLAVISPTACCRAAPSRVAWRRDSRNW